MGFLAILSVSAILGAIVPAASAQPGIVTASPGYINLGMTTSIAVTGPSAGSYTVIIEAPNGVQQSVVYVVPSAGQTTTMVYGNASSGWQAVVNQLGTYNVLVYQGVSPSGAPLSSTTFYTTNQIFVTTDFIAAGYCDFVTSGTRGQELLFQIHAVYASTGQPIALTSAAAALDKVSFTLPDGTPEAASFHAASTAAWPVPWFQAHVWGTWNVPWVGNYAPVVTVSDPNGNTGSLNTKTIGYVFLYSPATLQTSVTLTDTSSGKPVAGFVNNE